MTDTDREAFEAWASNSPVNLAKHNDGMYASSVAAFAWRAYKAATQRQQSRIAALEAEVQALRKDAEWQTIETAPKDHGVTQFDVWANGERYPGCFWGRATYEPGDSGIVYQSDYDWNGPVDSYVKGATHWKPLPPAPGEAMNKEGARD
jgi:hypothetical protein